MGSNGTKAAVFSTWLRGQMGQRGLSNRALGKLVDPSNPERGRRKVLRHLSGRHFPSAPSRAGYLDVFGLDGDPFADEEEPQDMAAALKAITAQLARLQKQVAA